MSLEDCERAICQYYSATMIQIIKAIESNTLDEKKAIQLMKRKSNAVTFCEKFTPGINQVRESFKDETSCRLSIMQGLEWQEKTLSKGLNRKDWSLYHLSRFGQGARTGRNGI